MKELIDLTNVVGKPSSDKSIVEVLQLFNIQPEKVKLKKGEESVILENRKSGIQFTFCLLDNLRFSLRKLDIESIPGLLKTLDNMDKLPEGSLFLECFDIDTKKNGIPLNQLIPFDLRFGMSKSDVYSLLGKPTAMENIEFNNSSWIYNHSILIARFDQENTLSSFGLRFIDGRHL